MIVDIGDLGEDTQAIVRLLVSCRAHIGNVAGDFRRKYGTQRVPDINRWWIDRWWIDRWWIDNYRVFL